MREALIEWRANTGRVHATRDELVGEFRARDPVIVDELLASLNLIRRIDRVTALAADGLHRLRKVETMSLACSRAQQRNLVDECSACSRMTVSVTEVKAVTMSWFLTRLSQTLRRR